jgi:hypothetical protein
MKTRFSLARLKMQPEEEISKLTYIFPLVRWNAAAAALFFFENDSKVSFVRLPRVTSGRSINYKQLRYTQRLEIRALQKREGKVQPNERQFIHPGRVCERNNNVSRSTLLSFGSSSRDSLHKLAPCAFHSAAIE